jgi:aerobic carbon-monoxide dehydrogenase small subunit
MNAELHITVNGQRRALNTDPRRPLLDVLREDLQLTGTKYGCGEAQCGACTVLMEGRRVYACVTPVAQAEGRQITTIEGLADGDSLHPVQEAFLAENAFQCGYCTPGMILTAVTLLEENPNPTNEEIPTGMNANLCRCCGYPAIVNAVRRAAQQAQQGR